MSFIVCLGKICWPKIEVNKTMLRIVLGPVSFWVLLYDFEKVLAKIKELTK